MTNQPEPFPVCCRFSPDHEKPLADRAPDPVVIADEFASDAYLYEFAPAARPTGPIAPRFERAGPAPEAVGPLVSRSEVRGFIRLERRFISELASSHAQHRRGSEPAGAARILAELAVRFKPGAVLSIAQIAKAVRCTHDVAAAVRRWSIDNAKWPYSATGERRALTVARRPPSKDRSGKLHGDRPESERAQIQREGRQVAARSRAATKSRTGGKREGSGISEQESGGK